MRPTVVMACAVLCAGCFSDTVAPVGDTTAGEAGGTSPQTASTASVSGSPTSAEDSTSGGGPGATTSPSTSSDTELGSSTEARAESSSTSGEPFSVCPSFIDDFEDGREDPVWLQAPNSASEEVDGEWKILVSAAGEDEFARMLIPLPGGFEDGTARFEIGTPPNDDNVLLILWLQQNDGEGRVAFNLIQLGALLELQARVTSEAGPPGVVVDSAPWDMVADKWMQLREDAGMLHFETSPDGVAFSPVFSITAPISLENVSVGIVGHNRDDLPTDVEVSVLNFELSCVD